MTTFMETVREQRWDDHRFYHQSRINQSLHFISAMSFVVAYALLFVDPPIAALVAWLVGMLTRQSGHFFFEPDGYDHANQVTNEYKEEVKVGYNIFRKIILMAMWALLPLLLLVNPSLLGLLKQPATWMDYARNLGMIWLTFGIVAIAFRAIRLFFLQNVQAGLAWVFKLMTDPFHDIKLYYKSPYYLMKGELIDPTIAGSRPH